jgi:TolB-like protein
MKKFVLSILFFNLIVLGWAQNLRVAVPSFTAKSGFSQDDAEILTDLFSSYLVEAGGFEVLTRTEVDKLLGEIEFQASGLTSDSDYARLGAALNAKAVITGNVMKLSSKGFFTVSVVDVESFKVLSSSRTAFDDIVEIVDKMPVLANAIIRQIQTQNLMEVLYLQIKDSLAGFNYKIVTFDFQPMDNDERKSFLGKYLADQINSYLSKNTSHSIIRTETLMPLVKNELSFQYSGEIDDESITIGTVFGADIVIEGKMSKTNQGIYISIEVIDVRTAEIKLSTSFTLYDQESLDMYNRNI